jgi:hypothetical protein
MVAGTTTSHDGGNVGDIGTIIDACIAEIDRVFYLIAILRIGSGNEQAAVIRITSAQADAFEAAGIDTCRIQDTLPAATGGRTVTILCGFVAGDNIYLVVRVTRSNHPTRLVRIPLCTVLGAAC